MPNQMRMPKTSTLRTFLLRASSCSRLLWVLDLFYWRVIFIVPSENSSSHISCPRSHQPIPGSPLPHRDHSHCNWRRGRAKQRQRRCHTLIPYWLEQTAGCEKADWSCPCIKVLAAGVRFRSSACYVSKSMLLCHDTRWLSFGLASLQNFMMLTLDLVFTCIPQVYKWSFSLSS